MLPVISTNSGNVEFVQALVSREALFLIVGGAAVAVHGCRDPREVKDLDILLDPHLANVERVVSALVSVGFNAVEASGLTRPAVHAQLKTHQLWLDLLTPFPDEDFAGMLERSTSATIGYATVRVAGRGDLIAMKRRAAEQSKDDAAKHERDIERLMAGGPAA